MASTAEEAQIFYRQLRGDCLRYLCEMELETAAKLQLQAESLDACVPTYRHSHARHSHARHSLTLSLSHWRVTHIVNLGALRMPV